MTTHNRYLFALDLGTTTIKVGLFDVSGKQVNLAIRENRLTFPIHGWVEQSIAMTWKLITECVREIMVGISPKSVEAISLSVQRGSVVPLTNHGKPLTDLIVWMDERGLPYVEKTRRDLKNTTYYGIAGHPISPISGFSKILWLHNEQPQIWDKAAVVGNQQTVILKMLGCDELVMDYSVGSFFFPFDIQKKEWSTTIASSLEIPLGKLPKLVSSTKVVGKLSHEAANELGLLPGISLVAGGGDGQCAGVGSGAVLPGRTMVNVGTSSGIQSYLVKPQFDPNCVLNCGAHIVDNAWEFEGHTQASGSVLKWFRDEFGYIEKLLELNSSHNAYDLIIDQAKTSPAYEDGLLFIPTFYGTTAPLLESAARGVLIGLTQSHKRSDIIRAILEGISLEIRWIIDAFDDIDIHTDEVRLVGGGALNSKWNQIHADIFSRPVKTLENADASLVGAAMCAAMAIGEYPNILDATGQFVRSTKEYIPSINYRPIYDEAYSHYRELFTTLSNQKLFRR